MKLQSLSSLLQAVSCALSPTILAQPNPPGDQEDVHAYSLQYPNCPAENSTYLKMQICLMQITGAMTQENLREVNYVSNANAGPTT